MVDMQTAPVNAQEPTPAAESTATAAAQPTKNKRSLILVLAIVGAVLVGAVLFLALAPPSPDTGLAGCRSIAAASGSDGPTEAEYRRIRGEFAGSGDRELREAGTQFMDLIWRYDQGQLAESEQGRLFELYTRIGQLCTDRGVQLDGPAS